MRMVKNRFLNHRTEKLALKQMGKMRTWMERQRGSVHVALCIDRPLTMNLSPFVSVISVILFYPD